MRLRPLLIRRLRISCRKTLAPSAGRCAAAHVRSGISEDRPAVAHGRAGLPLRLSATGAGAVRGRVHPDGGRQECAADAPRPALRFPHSSAEPHPGQAYRPERHPGGSEPRRSGRRDGVLRRFPDQCRSGSEYRRPNVRYPGYPPGADRRQSPCPVRSDPELRPQSVETWFLPLYP